MAISNLLGLGRAVGLNNFSQIKNLARAIEGNASNGGACIVVDKKMTDAMRKFSESQLGVLAGIQRKFLNIIDYYNPMISKKDAKTIYDIVFNRYGQNSRSVSLKGKGFSSNGEVYATMNFKSLQNDAGGRVYFKASIPSAQVSAEMDNALLNKAVPKTDRFDLLEKSVGYDTNDGISTLRVAPIYVNGGKVQGHVQAPKGLFDDITRVFSDYEYMDFGSMLENFLKIHK